MLIKSYPTVTYLNTLNKYYLMQVSTKQYDIIFICGEQYFDHPLCGIAILKHLLEREGYSVAVIDSPVNDSEITRYGAPKLFFGVSSGSIDSMVRNYTPMKRRRDEDVHLNYDEYIPDRAITVYSNWVRQHFKTSKIVLGGTEATLRRFSHYDFWSNKLRKSVLLDTRADILVYGNGEKQSLEIAERLKNDQDLIGIPGTCILSKELPGGFIELPSNDEIVDSKESFTDAQNLFTNKKNLAQKQLTRYVLQYAMPEYTTKDLDDYYSFDFDRDIPRGANYLRGFQFSVVTHRGCIGECNFCAINLTQGNKIISRSKESILLELKKIQEHPQFRGQVDDLTGPSMNMYGLDCSQSFNCDKKCMDCKLTDKTNKNTIDLLKAARNVPGIRKVNIKSGIRSDLASSELLKELTEHHIFETLRIAPEHVNPEVLKLMNKDRETLDDFIIRFKKIAPTTKLSFYFMIGHPGCDMTNTEELADAINRLKHTETVQLFTPTPMSNSTCMYYTSTDLSKKQIYVPYTYNEKKEQKRIILDVVK